MSLKNKLFVSLIFLMMGVGVFAQAKYTIKLASDAPDGTIWVTSIKNISSQLSAKTNGQVAITVYPGSVMGDQSSVLKKIKIGQLNSAAFSSGGLSFVYKDFGIMGFPMIFTNYEEYDYIKSKMYPFFEKEFEKRGFVLLSLSEVGLIYLYSSKKVNSVETLRVAKPLLLEGDDVSKALFDEMKASPVPVQISDVMTGLQTGLLDTIFSTPYTLIATQWFTRVKYMADQPITLMIGGILVEKNFFYSMPESYRNEIKSLFKSSFEVLNTKVRKDNNDAMQSLKKAGITVLAVPDKDKATFLSVCGNTATKLTEKEYSRDLLNTIKGHVADYRKNKK